MSAPLQRAVLMQVCPWAALPPVICYYGVWSYANVDGSFGSAAGITDPSVREHLSSLTVKPKIMLAAGNWDFGQEPVKTFGKNLSELGLDYTYLQVPAAHDWECWQLTFANAAENFLWK